MRPSAIVGIAIGALVALLALGWASEAHNLVFYQFWAPKREAVRREVYEQTKSYRKGSADRLSSLCGQLEAAGESQKGLIRDQIANEFSDFSTGDVPDYLRSCLTNAR